MLEDSEARYKELDSARREWIEFRAQLAAAQAISYTEDRIADIVSDVQAQRQHMPAFLNAMATVPALSFELSTLRSIQETAVASTARELERFGAEHRRLTDAAEETANDQSAARSQLEQINAETERAAIELRTLKDALADGQNDRGNLWKSAEQATRSVGELWHRLEFVHNAAEKSASDQSAARGELEQNLEQVKARTELGANEVRALRDVLADAQTDRGNLWKSAEQATRNIGELWHRLEFVRKEIMYEMRFGSGGAATTGESPVRTTRIVDEEKVAAARASGTVRLNLGCGHVPLPGYLNVDFRDLPGIDIVAEASALPFEPQSVSEIASFHVLEHFPEEQLKRLLPYWRSLLKSKGMFRAVVPDGEAMLAHQAAGTYSFDDFRMVLFGAQEYEGDFHFNMYTPDSLGKLLTKAGFYSIDVPVKGRKNDISFEFEITAKAP